MKKIETGTVFRLPISFDMGDAYCKLIDFSNVSMYYGILIKVFDYFESKKIEDVEFFRGMPLFMNPIAIARMPSVRGKYAWKKIGVIKEYSDGNVPVFKDIDGNGFGWDTLEKYKSMKWYAKVNFNERVGPVDFDKVRHLEEVYLRSTITIEKRIAMQLLRYKGIDLEAFLTLHAPDMNWKVDYNTQKFIPLYKTLPVPIRGMPLIKGYVPDEYLNWKWE